MHTDTNILILHNVPRPEGSDGVWNESDAGVIAEVDAVADALIKLNLPHRVAGVANLCDLPGVLATARESIVVNLVEGFHSNPADANLVPALCRAFGKECTGSDTTTLLTTLDKWQTKASLQASGLRTPAGIMIRPGQPVIDSTLPKGALIAKPVAADASEGIDAACVVAGAGAALSAAVERIHNSCNQAALVEQYIGERELNVSLLETDGGVIVMPIAEIVFTFPDDRPRIVDYAAKWLVDSTEYRHTQRRIPADLTPEQAEEVRRQALDAWHVLGCRDYVRVDFRLDADGLPWILEVNANPDISPDAGFAAAVDAGGVAYEAFIEQLISNATRRLAERTPSLQPKAEGSHNIADVAIRFSRASDRDAVLGLLEATGFFRPDEIEIAREVLDDAIAKGSDGHYQSLVAEVEGQIAGWVCYGPTPCTVCTYDIYWLGVAPAVQSRGIGKALIAFSEEEIRKRGGRLAVIETSGAERYLPSRAFYRKIGYRQEAAVSDFYAPGDAKIIYTKLL